MMTIKQILMSDGLFYCALTASILTCLIIAGTTIRQAIKNYEEQDQNDNNDQ